MVQRVLWPTVSQAAVISIVLSDSTNLLLVCLKSQTFSDFVMFCSRPLSYLSVSQLRAQTWGIILLSATPLPPSPPDSEHKSQASCENELQHFS